jgi:hypothetical protein
MSLDFPSTKHSHFYGWQTLVFILYLRNLDIIHLPVVLHRATSNRSNVLGAELPLNLLLLDLINDVSMKALCFFIFNLFGEKKVKSDCNECSDSEAGFEYEDNCVLDWSV